MAEAEANLEDLEDGEIESNGEEDVATDPVNDIKKQEDNEQPTVEQPGTQDANQEEPNDYYRSKSGKKKKSKSNKDSTKSKEKSKRSRKYSSPCQDDFASNVEKAIRKAMNKNSDADNNPDEDVDERRKHKKRKKYDSRDGQSKKRKKQDFQDEMDESEMMCVRGASPVQKESPAEPFNNDENESYDSESSHDSRGHQQHRSQRHRPSQRERNKNKNDRRSRAHPMQDPDGVCLYYMQGKCHKGDECIYSHDAQPPRKMELCKFYLMECCAKRDKCLYMHADFPCKYYHTGLQCIYKDECKFAHGKPLSDALKNILLKHIESAPKEILGDFPRLNREGAMKMIQTTQMKLIQQYSENNDNSEKSIPSLFELNIPHPQMMSDQQSLNQFNNENSIKLSPKIRHSRWQNESNNQNFKNNAPPNVNSTNVLNIKNLTGVLTPRQITDLTKMGVENLDQLSRFTVLQLSSIGISIKQITEIQLNTINIQQLGLINSETEQPSANFITSSTKDMDLRVAPVVPVSKNAPASILPGQDIDMRFQTSLPPSTVDETNQTKRKKQLNKDMIDIDQYTKDALKFAVADKDNNSNEEPLDNSKLIAESKDVDHRVLPFSEEIDNRSTETNKKDCDTDIRFLQPEPIFKSQEKKHRRSTTDDEDNNLLIDEKWYSSDEEKTSKRRSPSSSPKPASISPQFPRPHIIEPPSALLSKLGDLSKIDISEEVTKLLNTMKNNLNENKAEKSPEPETPKSRDPRNQRRSPDKLIDGSKTPVKKVPRVSIYECVDGEPTDGRRRLDVDLRKAEVPVFGDTDLRQSSSGDIDFRLGLPFKAIPNYTPASEIDGSINSHPSIPYKLVIIDIPRPDYTDIRNSTAKSQALQDPRLRKVFRLSKDESNSDSEKEKPPKPASVTPRVDPRRKPKDNVIGSPSHDIKPSFLDLQTILQSSSWYKELSTTQKIFVNQHLAPVTQQIKQFNQEKMPGMKFDLTSIRNDNVICSIFSNLGISLGENGEYSYLPKPKEPLLKTPINFNQAPIPFGVNSNNVEDNMNLMNMQGMGMNNAPMNNMNMGPMHGFNPSYSDPRVGSGPSLLGPMPNMPHNFNGNNFGGPNNFGNRPFNGPGGDFNFMDNDPNFQRFPNRGGFRGRNNDRWNRGGNTRGGGNRKHFSGDRGNWKN